MGQLSRLKGKKGEQEAVHLFRSLGFTKARRRLSQYQSSCGADLENVEPFVVQVTRGSKSIQKALREAQAEVKNEEIALALKREDRGVWLVAFTWTDFLKTLRFFNRSSLPLSEDKPPLASGLPPLSSPAGHTLSA
jgi:hypothetical protein